MKVEVSRVDRGGGPRSAELLREVRGPHALLEPRRGAAFTRNSLPQRVKVVDSRRGWDAMTARRRRKASGSRPLLAPHFTRLG